MEPAKQDLTAALWPPRLILYAYALSAGVSDLHNLATALQLHDPPDSAAAAWEHCGRAVLYPPLAVVSDDYGLDECMRFAVNMAFAAALDDAMLSVITALGGGLTAAFAIRVYSASAEEAINWRVKWLAHEQTLQLLFTETENLRLHPVVLRFLLGAADRDSLPCHFDRLAARVNAAFTWDDLVLPYAQKALLRHICDRVRFGKTVYGDWGFAGKVPYGRGVRALFSGPPGTGKTMASQVIACELGMTLYRVDLSALVSKYIGETEKNLGQVFQSAAKSGGILFFDEADAIFGKRGEQKDSHDKYANMQTSFLLQQVEDYDGVVLLATNFISNLDPAFTRRIQIRVDFSAPDGSARLAIWRSLLRGPAPIADDVDFDFLANNFELTGSEIKNIILAAAFIAASEGTEITMRQLIRALAMEYAKTDKILSRKELGEYA